MILVIDNYDSFVYNLVHYIEDLGASTEVVRNDALSVRDSDSLPQENASGLLFGQLCVVGEQFQVALVAVDLIPLSTSSFDQDPCIAQDFDRLDRRRFAHLQQFTGHRTADNGMLR